MNQIPIVILCHNNEYYVNNTIIQLERYHNNFIILDNFSDDVDTLKYLDNVSLKYKVVRTDAHYEPYKARNFIYDQLPIHFCFTDPDLEYSKNLPADFIDKLIQISDRHKVQKIGLALKIDDYNEMYQGNYVFEKTIYEWEIKFWQNKIDDDIYELYEADVDTTFALYNKNIPTSKVLRVAGNFTCKHLPWYVNNNNKIDKDVFNKMYKNSKWSTTANAFNKFKNS